MGSVDGSNHQSKIKQLLVALFLVIHAWAFAQCADVQQFNATQQQQLSATFSSLQLALRQKNLNAIDSISLIGKTQMGTEAGQPESATTFTTITSNTVWPSSFNALLLSRTLIDADSAVYAQIWKPWKGMAPPSYAPHSIPLRSGAEVCIGLFRISAAELDINRKTNYYNWAKRGLDSLLTMQLSYGAFPFPDLRPYNDPVFTPIINNYLQSLGADSVNVLLNGWIISDRGTGEFKFDAGVIGAAFAEAFLFTGDTNYRNAAIRTSHYLDSLNYNTNYNYNTFQAYGIALGAHVQGTNISQFIAADSVLRYSVVPGQIASGMWMDGHNAKPVYHAIIVHNVAAALHHSPNTFPWSDTAIYMLQKAVRADLNLFYTCGASHGFDSWLRAWRCDTSIIPQSLHDSISDVIGRHINEAILNGRFLDVYTMGLFLDVNMNLSSISDTPDDITVKVFPNPGNETLNIQGLPQNSRVTVFDVTGKWIYMNEPSDSNLMLSVNSWNQGLYIIHVQQGNRSYSAKWLKQ
jgi:hypothetical protein